MLHENHGVADRFSQPAAGIEVSMGVDWDRILFRRIARDYCFNLSILILIFFLKQSATCPPCRASGSGVRRRRSTGCGTSLVPARHDLSSADACHRQLNIRLHLCSYSLNCRHLGPVLISPAQYLIGFQLRIFLTSDRLSPTECQVDTYLVLAASCRDCRRLWLPWSRRARPTNSRRSRPRGPGSSHS